MVRRWQGDQFSNHMRKIKEFNETLDNILFVQMPIGQTKAMVYQDKMRELTMELNQLQLVEKRMWKQKSRVRLFHEGDCNITYFHRIMPCRRRSNIITPAKVGLDEEAPAASLKVVVTEAFRRRFELGHRMHMDRWDVRFPCLN